MYKTKEKYTEKKIQISFEEYKKECDNHSEEKKKQKVYLDI